MNKKSFNLYKSWAPLILNMNPEQAGQLFKAIFLYQEDGTEPKVSSSIYPFFALMKAKFEEDNKAYQEKCEKNKRTAIEREDAKRAQMCTNVHERVPNTTAIHQNAPECTDTDTDTDTDNDTDTKKDKEREGEPRKRGPFTPPTVEEVKSYCQERKNNVDAERFVDFYSSKGWMIGKSKMRDWKASVRTWETRETARSGTTKEFNQSYDFESIEKALVMN
jgi:hypothetical protein